MRVVPEEFTKESNKKKESAMAAIPLMLLLGY